MQKKQTYIIGVCNSEADDVITNRVIGTQSQLKEFLVSLVKEDRKSTDDFRWDGGTENTKEVQVYADGKMYAFAMYTTHHVDFTATPEMEPVVL